MQRQGSHLRFSLFLAFHQPCPFYTDACPLTVLLLHGRKGESGEQQYGGSGQVSQPSVPSINLASCVPSINSTW